MYDDRLEKLIELALIDGTLNEKEKQILIRNARELGIDEDEFEMVLEARLFQKQKEIPTQFKSENSEPRNVSNDPKPNTNQKCTSCGGVLEILNASCPYCGFDLSSAEVAASSQRLYAELMRVEEEERNRTNDTSSNFLSNFLSGRYSVNEEEFIKQKIFSRKTGVISTFPIPNTKLDIVEFLSLAVGEGGKKITFFMQDEEKSYIRAWRSKAEQVIIKARFILREDKKMLEEIEFYAKQLNIN